nr:hypothetical protein [Tanacetum cinerariifolium]
MGQNLEKHDTSSRSRNDTHAEDADIKPVNDKEPRAEVQLTAEHNILDNEQQHYVQSEAIYDTCLLEKTLHDVLSKTLHCVLSKILYCVLSKILHCVLSKIIHCVLSKILHCVVSKTLHCVLPIKDRPPMLAPGNYFQWKSRIKRYIYTKPNHELIHYCLTNPSYKLDWKEKEVSISEGSPITRTKRVHETYKNVSQEIRDQLNVEAEAVQIILT